MDDFLSKQTTINILLTVLIVLNIATLVVFGKAFGKMQRTLDYIGDNTRKMSGALEQIDGNTEYMQYR